MKTTLLVSVLAGATLPFAALASGPLVPPSGPATPIFKSLDEVEPRRSVQSLAGAADAVHVINQPGSYYLTADVTLAPNKHGIVISAAGNVTIDLNGFTIRGGGTSGTPGARGIWAGVPGYNITVKNGIVSGAGSDGVYLNAAASVRVEDVQVQNVGGIGICVGAHSTVKDCVVSQTLLEGVVATDRAVITNTIANGCALDGFRVGSSSQLTGCNADFNLKDGFDLGLSSTATSCNARDNTEHGFNVQDSVVLTTCTATGSGINGFLARNQLNMVACTANSNTTNGVLASGTGAMISNTTSYANLQVGIKTTGDGANITDCTTYANGKDGIEVWRLSFIKGCNSSRNGTVSQDGAGIRLTNEANRVDDCMLNANDIGVVAGATGNMVTRNSFTFNPQAVTATPGNNVAAIVTVPGNNFSSTNAWANLAH